MCDITKGESMYKGENVVSHKLDVKGKTIYQIIKWYYADALIVNRRYQRKLVWSLEEKRLFIDSIINGYPTPSIIVSAYDDGDDEDEWYEIIDGLQRLNAIVSFVDNDFGIMIDGEEKFFDLKIIGATTRLDKQQYPTLERYICDIFVDQEIPVVVTVQKKNREKSIEKIFQRINSSGRKLSAHDIRQASSVGEFPDLIRRIATDCRGDYTYSDNLCLCDMPKISLSSAGLNYGIDPDTTFWRRHDIIPFYRFRQSLDEEILAKAMAIVLLGDDISVSTDGLNALYCDDTPEAIKVTKIIKDIGKEELEQYAREVISQIDDIFASVNSNFTSFLCSKKNEAGKDIGFIIIFCALYRLKREGYVIENYKKIALSLKQVFFTSFSWSMRDIVYNELKSYMVKQIPRAKTVDEYLLEDLLSRSPIELQCVEFKIGLTYFDSGKFNYYEIERIWCTLVAMANTMRDGYVIIGVANSDKSCKDWQDVYNSLPITYGKHKIVGITDEATRSFLDEDHYEQNVCNLIKNSKISEPLKGYVLANYRLTNFHEKTLLILPAKKQASISYYDGVQYVREGTITRKVDDLRRIERF